ncbi:MAG: hypothetical protein VW239_00255 [Candidatus Nanopelagicales bacterium]
MSWGYRILRHDGDETVYAMHEVYYDKDGNPNGWAEKAMYVADSAVELKEVWLTQAQAFWQKPLVVRGERLEEGV